MLFHLSCVIFHVVNYVLRIKVGFVWDLKSLSAIVSSTPNKGSNLVLAFLIMSIVSSHGLFVWYSGFCLLNCRWSSRFACGLYFLFYFFLRFSAPSGFPWASWHVDCWWCTVQCSWWKPCFCNLYYLYGNFDHVKMDLLRFGWKIIECSCIYKANLVSFLCQIVFNQNGEIWLKKTT